MEVLIGNKEYFKANFSGKVSKGGSREIRWLSNGMMKTKLLLEKP